MPVTSVNPTGGRILDRVQGARLPRLALKLADVPERRLPDCSRPMRRWSHSHTHSHTHTHTHTHTHKTTSPHQIARRHLDGVTEHKHDRCVREGGLQDVGVGGVCRLKLEDDVLAIGVGTHGLDNHPERLDAARQQRGEGGKTSVNGRIHLGTHVRARGSWHCRI